MKREKIHLPFVHKNGGDMAPSTALEIARKAQNAVYNAFNAKRNAGRIDRYFLLLRSSRIERIYYYTGFVLMCVILLLCQILVRQSYSSYSQELKNLISETIFAKMYNSIRATVEEPIFIANFLSSFLTNPLLFTGKGTNAVNISGLLYKYYMTGVDTMASMMIGYGIGKLVGVHFHKEDDERFLLYSNATVLVNGTLMHWIADENGYNASYPESGGDVIEENYNTSKQIWYLTGAKSKETTSTPIYFGKNVYTPQFSIVSPGINKENNILQLVVSLDITLDVIQDLLTKNSKNVSRLAITSNDGLLIGVTGEDAPIEDVQYEVITKTIPELKDPLWRCVSSNPMFRSNENYTTICDLEDGEEHQFNVLRANIPLSIATNWTLTAIFDHDEFAPNESVQFPFNDFFLPIIIVIIIWFILALFLYFSKRYLKYAQYKLLLKPKTEDLIYMKHYGIIHAIELLRKIALAYSDNDSVHSVARQAINEITSSNNKLMFDVTRFLNRFEDPRVRQKIISLLKINLIATELPNTIDSNPLKNSSDAFLKISETQNIDGIASSSQQFHLDGFTRHRNIIHVMNINTIVSEVCHLNSVDVFFDEVLFEQYIRDLISTVPQNLHFFITDSVDLFYIIAKNKMSKMIFDIDMNLAIAVALLIYHNIMINRTSPQTPLVNRYFITNTDIFTAKAKEYLFRLYDLMKEKNESSLKRWKNFVGYVLLLVRNSSLENHIPIINECFVYISYELKQKLMFCESIVLMKMVFNFMTISYVIAPPDTTNYAHRVLNGDDYQNNEAIAKFISCMNGNYLKNGLETLKRAFGCKIFTKLMDNEY